jgi:Tfp pilus assembly protein PilX
MGNFLHNEQGIALPLVLIFTAAFSVIGLGTLDISTDEIKLVTNYEDGIRAMYHAEGALNVALANLYVNTNSQGSYEFTPAIPHGQRGAIAEITQSGATRIIRATGKSGGISKQVEMRIDIQTGNSGKIKLVPGLWKDYGVQNAPSF